MTISPAATTAVAAAAAAAAATAAAATVVVPVDLAIGVDGGLPEACGSFDSTDPDDPWADMPPLDCETCGEATSYGGCAYELASPTTALCQCHK